MKRAVLLVLLATPAFCPAQVPVAAPLPAAAAEQAEARRAEAIADAARTAAEMPGRAACALFPANSRGLPAFKADAKGNLSLDLEVQIDLSALKDRKSVV